MMTYWFLIGFIAAIVYRVVIYWIYKKTLTYGDIAIGVIFVVGGPAVAFSVAFVAMVDLLVYLDRIKFWKKPVFKRKVRYD